MRPAGNSAPKRSRPKRRASVAVGRLVAERAIAAGVTTVVFDRGGYRFHGRVKALADAAREGGLVFLMVSPASRRGARGGPGNRGGGPGNRGNAPGNRGGEGGGERRGGRGGRGRDREQRPREDDSGGMSERVVHTRRIAKVVKGGRRLRFNALVVVGDGQGRVGVGMGKALAIPDAVRKGTAVARRSTINIPIKGSTIPHEISVRKGASIVIIKPAPLGTGIIAAGAMRAMLELGGVQDVVGKSLGSRNPINIVQATLEALGQLRDPETERAARLGHRSAGDQRNVASSAPPPPLRRPPDRQRPNRPPSRPQQNPDAAPAATAEDTPPAGVADPPAGDTGESA